MELNKKQTEFWTVLLIVCLVVSVAIMLVDFQIKQAILEESTRLKLVIEEWEVRYSGHRQDNQRTTNDSANDATISGPVLVDPATRMEAGAIPLHPETEANGRTGTRGKPRGKAGN